MVTASFGIAQLGGGSGAAETPGDMQRNAELALQFAKFNGRNECVAWSFEVAEQVYARRADMPAETPSLRAMRALAWAVDSRDPNTYEHSERVANLAVTIASALGRTHERCIQLREAGIVHDVGKIAVPDAILLKDGRLTDAEMDEMKRHPEVGAKIVADVLSADQAVWVRGHHERWDGRGYPDGLAGEEIPEEARVLALADAFDVMRSARTYKEARDPPGRWGEARAKLGSQFWPVAVEALERLVAEGVITDALAAAREDSGAFAATAAADPGPGYARGLPHASSCTRVRHGRLMAFSRGGRPTGNSVGYPSGVMTGTPISSGRPNALRSSDSLNQWNTVGTVPMPFARAATKRFSMANATDISSARASLSRSSGGKVSRGTTRPITHTGTWRYELQHLMGVGHRGLGVLLGGVPWPPAGPW